ncbi:MAG: hypothetical protein HEQ39_06370 [Rhizobacter sp.]
MSFNEAARNRARAKLTTLRTDPAYAEHKAWGVDQVTLADQLDIRLSGKSDAWPHQGQTALCGPAAFMFCLVQDRPDMYVDLVINLWLGQPASLGGNSAVGPTMIRPVNPSPHVQTNTPAAVTGEIGAINAVDWISMASLRNDSPDLNPFGDYDHPKNQVSAIARPKYVKGWFESAGAHCLWDNTSEILPTADWKELTELSAYNGGWVLMLVASAMFAEGHPGYPFKNHWVVLNGSITIDGRDWSMYRSGAAKLPETRENVDIQADFFTWGKTGRQLRAVRARPDLAFFLKCFYGGMAFSRIP